MGILISFLILRIISAAISTRLLANTSFGKSPGIMIMTALLAFMFPFFTPAALFIVPRLQKWMKRTTTSPMQEEINKINQTAEANKAKLQEKAKTNLKVYQVLEKSLNEIEQRRQAMVEEVMKKYETEDTIKRLGSYKKQELSEYLRNNQVSEDIIRRLADKVDWDTISTFQKLSEGFIREFADRVNWDSISEFQKLSEGIIKDFADKVNWREISIHQNLSEGFIRDFADKVNWEYISLIQDLSEPFIREFSDKVDWKSISCNQTLSEPFIREFYDKVDWDYLKKNKHLSGIDIDLLHAKIVPSELESILNTYTNEELNAYLRSNKVSEDIIRSVIDRVDLGIVCQNQTLSESFIREFMIDKVSWSDISFYQKLPEAFIDEFKDQVNWEIISCNQTLSEPFIRDFANRVDWENVSIFQNLSEGFIREFQDKVDWPGISRNQNLSESFIQEFADKVNWDGLKQNPNLSGIDIDALQANYLSSRFDFKQLGASAANEHIKANRDSEQQEKAMQYVQMQTKAMEANKTETQENKSSRRI